MSRTELSVLKAQARAKARSEAATKAKRAQRVNAVWLARDRDVARLLERLGVMPGVHRAGAHATSKSASLDIRCTPEIAYEVVDECTRVHGWVGNIQLTMGDSVEGGERATGECVLATYVQKAHWVTGFGLRVYVDPLRYADALALCLRAGYKRGVIALHPRMGEHVGWPWRTESRDANETSSDAPEGWHEATDEELKEAGF